MIASSEYSDTDPLLEQFAGVGGRRPVHTVWQIACTLTTCSDLRTSGGDDDEGVDITLHRDIATGVVELRGSTVAGVLRHELDNRLRGCGNAEHPQVRLLFGGADEDDHTSSLTVFDACVEDGGPAPCARFGVALDQRTAVARTGALFESEALPAGARFVVSFELIVDTADREPELLELLLSAVDGLGPAGVRFGHRTATGNGVVQADGWTATRLDMRTDIGWQRWRVPDYRARRDTDRAASTASTRRTLAVALRAAWPDAPREPLPDTRARFTVTATLTPAHPDGTLLIRDIPTDLAGEHPPDHAHRFDRGGAVIQGSSLFDVLRAQTRRIVSAVEPPPGRTASARRRRQVFTDLWGSEPPGPGQRPAGDAAMLTPARLRITEPVLAGATPARITRIRIERLDGHVTEGHLVCDEVAVGGAGELTVTAPDAAPEHRALIIHALLDLHDGLATVGGAIGAGHGLLRLSGDALTIDGRPWLVSELRQPGSPLAGWSAALSAAVADPADTKEAAT